MPAPPGRPRPVATISAAQSWWSILSALVPGLIVLATAAAANQPITSAVLGGAALAVLAPLGGAEVARRRTVAQAEDAVTPNGDPRDDTGQQLTPPDVDLKRLLRQVLAAQGEPLPKRRTTDSGTRVGAPVETARPMRVDDPAAGYRPPRQQPHDPWPDSDYTGEGARLFDEREASRHGYRGGPRDGGPR